MDPNGTQVKDDNGEKNDAAGGRKVEMMKSVSEDPSEAWYDVPQEVPQPGGVNLQASFEDCDDIEKVH